jgi:hypothetical protein
MKTRSTFAESRQSTWLDVAAFATTLLLGVIMYFAFRALWGKHSQIGVTIALIALMLLYAVAVRFIPKLRVRMDQAGDNSYYLGLLFTLTSMAFALYDFGALADAGAPSSGVRQIIANFGIALGTTIAGIFLRVTLHQMRVDPADLEAMTRIELTEAADRLRSTLDTVTMDLSRFHLEVQQRSSDTLAELASQAKGISNAMVTELAAASKTIIAATTKAQTDGVAATEQIIRTVTVVANEAAAAVERLRSVQPPPLTLSRRLDKVASTLEDVTLHGERMNTEFAATAEVLKSAHNSTTQTAERLGQLVTAVQGEQAEITRQLAEMVAGLERDLHPFRDGLKCVLGDLTEIQKQAKESAHESTRAHRASVDVLASLSHVVRDMVNVVRTA